jgi:hypothetical protein
MPARIARRSKRFEAQHRPRDTFDRAVILLDNVVEIFDLPNRDRYFAFLVQLLHRCLVGAALVHRYLVGHSVVPYGLLEKAPGGGRITLGSQQKVDRLALLVDCPIQVFPGAVDPDVHLIHPPTGTGGVLVLSAGCLKQWQKPDRPAVDRGIVSRRTTFLHHFFEMPVTQGIGSLPANADQNHVDRKSLYFGIQHSCLPTIQRQESTGQHRSPLLMGQIRNLSPLLLTQSIR